ncbi:heptosyltransferase [Geobacter sp. AOG1]|nr:heptosyltransferase [Geobacter sp. AOG1]
MIGSIVTACLPSAQVRPLSSPRNFLLIRPGGIGDAVLLVPAILALKDMYPDARITVLAEKRNGAVFTLCPAIDEILHYDRPGELLSAIRSRYDVVIDAEQWHRLSAVVARIVSAPWSIGFATNGRKKLFSHPVPYSHDDYEADSFSHLLGPLGLMSDVPVPVSFLTVPEVARRQADKLLEVLSGNSFVTIFPGASIPERRWSEERFAAVAALLNERGVSVVAVGGGEDAAVGERILAGRRGVNLAGKTSLLETAAVIARGRLLVSGDSGVLHLAVGLGKPTVSLFGPGIVRKWAPRGPSHIVLNKGLPCSPCTKFGYTSKCSINARCMADITVDEVIQAVELVMVGRSRGEDQEGSEGKDISHDHGHD